MAQKITHTVVKPEYYDKFMCINAACEHNCCKRGWEIVIDKSTYLKYRNVKDPEFHNKQKECVKRIKDNTVNDLRYAKFVFPDGKLCPFQSKEGLCEIHRDLGEDFLCRTCRVYPRRLGKMVTDYLELSISMSCPQAVQTALFDEKPIEFNMETMDFRANDSFLKAYTYPTQGDVETYYLRNGWAMREAAITIMQKKTCPVAYRLIVIAMMLDEVVKIHEEGKADEIPELLEYYSQSEYGQSFVDQFDDLEPNDDLSFQMNLLLYHTISEKYGKMKNTVFSELKEKYEKYAQEKGLNREETDSAMEYHKYLVGKINENWGKFLEQWEYVLENYLVNFMFAEIFPLKYHAKGLNPYQHAFILAEQYALLRMLLCGNYDEKEGFSKKYVTHTIFQLAVVNQHSQEPFITTKNYNLLDSDSPAHLYYLLI